MIAVDIKVTANTAENAIGAVVEICRPENLLPLLAETVADAMRENFMMLDATRPNKLGGERQHYYAGAAQSVDWRQASGDKAVVFTDQIGIVTRYFGGTIRAGVGTVQCGPNAGQPTTYLTIPVVPEAYGKRPCEIPGLQVLWGRNGPYGLGMVEEGLMAHGSSDGAPTSRSVRVFYVFKTEVNIPEDKTLLPAPEVLDGRLKEVFSATLENVTELVMQGVAERGQQAAVESALEYAQQSFGGPN